jgi:hypothetical protein
MNDKSKMTTDEKIVFMVEHALATSNHSLLYALSELLDRRGKFEYKLSQLTRENK